MNLTPEQKEIGRENYYEAAEAADRFGPFSRRNFLKATVASGVVSGAGLGAAYFHYSTVNDPVRIGVIGTGDEGQVLIGAMNPQYVQVKAIADIRPYNVHRAFYGDWASPAALAARPGLIKKFGDDAKNIEVYGIENGGYQELLNDPDIEAVVIALPLHLHAQAACDALKAGKHVLTEKLMAHNVAQCKVMSRLAAEKNLLLATGHQRHYSVLYENAVNMIQWGLLGELHHIRAQWHRGNLPGKDSWQQPLPGGEIPFNGGEAKDRIVDHLKKLKDAHKKTKDNNNKEKLASQIKQWQAWDDDKAIKNKVKDFGYQDRQLSEDRFRPAYEELCRWRLWERTGGGLMAELGSHQLDAASIFISALTGGEKKTHPLSVHAVGGRHTFPHDRDAGDHVYCMFEFPAPGYGRDYFARFDLGYKDKAANYPGPEGIANYENDNEKKIVVTYSSIMGNGFGGYGEVVMGSKGTLVLEREKEVMLYKTSAASTRVGVKDAKVGPVLDTQASGEMGPVAKAAENQGPISRGYTEEIEHWAWCIRNRAPENQPRCKPEVAMGDAVIALTANTAIERTRKGESGYVQFEDGWFNIDDDSTPDGSDVAEEKSKLVG